METENNIFFEAPQTLEKNTRVDKFLSAETGFSREQIQRLTKSGNIFLNGTPVLDCAYKVRAGDCFMLKILPPVQADPTPQNITLDILYEDSDLIVINKPAGMVVHEGAGVHEGTLVNALLYHCGDSLSGIGGVKRPGIVHRIDKETSGILVAAKNDAAHQKLSKQFETHDIERTYIAFIFGVLTPLSGTVCGNIGRSKFDRKKMALLDMGGKSAVTHYQTLKVFPPFASMVRCKLETGRTHQIRVHLSSKGNCLIGDKVYTQRHTSSLKIPLQIKKNCSLFRGRLCMLQLSDLCTRQPVKSFSLKRLCPMI